MAAVYRGTPGGVTGSPYPAFTGTSIHSCPMKFGHHEKRSGFYAVGVERGAAGFSAAWSFDLPGCYALVPPGADVKERMSLAILEFTAWSHQRAADRLAVEPSEIDVVQTVETDEDLRNGDTSAFFVHDGEPANGREFPLWANPHDRALDELRDVTLSMPAALQDHRLDPEGRTLLGIVQHTAATERFYADQLRPGSGGVTKHGDDPSLRELQDAHMTLQQVLCDVPPELRTRRETSALHPFEEWSVRKVMRRSIWHLRYHTWELRKAIGGIWLD